MAAVKKPTFAEVIMRRRGERKQSYASMLKFGKLKKEEAKKTGQKRVNKNTGILQERIKKNSDKIQLLISLLISPEFEPEKINQIGFEIPKKKKQKKKK